jgi:hypothetical protein
MVSLCFFFPNLKSEKNLDSDFIRKQCLSGGVSDSSKNFTYIANFLQYLINHLSNSPYEDYLNF